jgi:hypothetical protein
MGGLCSRPRRAAEGQRLEVVKVISWAEAYEVLSRDFVFASHAKVSRMDLNYAVVARKDVEQFLGGNATNAFAYSASDFDCDDFAAVLWGRSKEWWYTYRPAIDGPNGSLALGFCSGDVRDDGNPGNDDRPRHHALNFVIVPKADDPDSLETWLIEPQNDKWYKPTDKTTISTLIM